MTSGKATRRGTTNTNVRGSSYQRRARKWHLLEVFQSPIFGAGWTHCYRCFALLCYETLTVDRIIPGCHGGRYTRGNIRPACGRCNYSTGAVLKAMITPEEERGRNLKIDEQVRRMDPPRYTRGQVAKIVGKSPDTLKRWKRNRIYMPSERRPFGQIMVDLYTDEDVKAMKKIAKGMKPGRKKSVA